MAAPIDADIIKGMEDTVFAKWENECPEVCGGLVYDGVADPKAFFAAPTRVLLILKEPRSDSTNWDFRETLCTHLDKGYTWNNASRWIQAAIEWRTPVPWSEADPQTQRTRIATMTRAAFINLKKTPRALSRPSASEKSEISGFVQRYREYLVAQISLYKPDITILGGTAEWLGDLFGDQQGIGQTTPSGLVYRKVDLLGYAVRMYHPGALRSKRKSYESLVKGLAEILSRPSIALSRAAPRD